MDDAASQGRSSKKIPQATSPPIISQPPGRLVIRILHDGIFSALVFEEFLLELPVEDLIRLGLTQREAEVLRWLAEGKTSHEIAAILHISPGTISKHLRRVYQKLSVENRHAAVAMAWEAVRSDTRE
jgi:DNA-binding CsgD family transcriptional regulator